MGTSKVVLLGCFASHTPFCGQSVGKARRDFRPDRLNATGVIRSIVLVMNGSKAATLAVLLF